VRQSESLKFFVFNNRQWCESHPLRHISLIIKELLADVVGLIPPSHESEFLEVIG
jgi:hypothetical protein